MRPTALGVEPRHLRRVREEGPAYPKSAGGMSALLRAAGLMDEEYALRQDALDALLRIDREEPLAAMADAVARTVAPLTGHDPNKLRELLDLIADSRPVLGDFAINVLKTP